MNVSLIQTNNAENDDFCVFRNTNILFSLLLSKRQSNWNWNGNVTTDVKSVKVRKNWWRKSQSYAVFMFTQWDQCEEKKMCDFLLSLNWKSNFYTIRLSLCDNLNKNVDKTCASPVTAKMKANKMDWWNIKNSQIKYYVKFQSIIEWLWIWFMFRWNKAICK